ncbi:cytochrome c nitrite reductase subunit NrfD [Muribacter muris]|uniref:Cytochrome c nitrite reductase subunit NrfD n=1 Tax=Muribacter muris TaxID=67855 RepID=A0A4Y9JYD9_9PAST|nr:cytochrome c nitrite reductase subunit NrfD [Muribacter muris]MBF0784967.1 cytochrome c nitrite reductase subunit NrfD [Muribacter muris]MBF0827275.1 cytochrome c nitrite reductase subunit NrfD [Muribacter muris]TFV10884.1 cytochrome c nitrite reductase subunit NrfD [Muribacter muris]
MNDYVPFQTPNLVWDSTIAIYLFLLGISAGSTLLAVLYKRSRQLAKPSESWIIRSTAIMAPGAIIIGLTLLIFHLARPWTFWFLMFNYQFGSVMSMGVMLFQVFMAVLFLWLAIIFKDLIATLIARFLPKLKFVLGLIDIAAKFTNLIELLLALLAVALGAYTGFLLSALISYPMLNNPVLPILFLASGTSSGIAALLIAILVIGKVSTHSDEVSFLHKFETPTVLCEILLLFAFFVGLYFGGGQKTLAAVNALSGFWGSVFWIGVVLIGLLFPLITGQIVSEKTKHNKGFIVLLATAGLIGVLCLRYFILYAGQLTIA